MAICERCKWEKHDGAFAEGAPRLCDTCRFELKGRDFVKTDEDGENDVPALNFHFKGPGQEKSPIRFHSIVAWRDNAGKTSFTFRSGNTFTCDEDPITVREQIGLALAMVGA